MSDLRKQADKTKKEYAESQSALGDEKKLLIDTQIDQQIATATADVEAKKATAAEEYRSIIDTAAVQRELDRRQIAETMANMGLTKSGLNATQQTAVQLSAGNKIAAAQRQRQAAVDALTKSLAEYKMTAENTRRESTMAVDEATQKSIAEYNASVDKTVAEAETAQAKAQADAVAAAAKSRSTILKNLYESGAITPDTYAYAEDVGLSPSQALEYQNNVPLSPSAVSGNNWSWSTTAYRKTGKDTKNWGKFLGFIGDAGVDENDYVEYYDASGQKRVVSLKELYDKLVAEGKMTPDQVKTFVNRFNRNDNDNVSYFLSPSGTAAEKYRTEIATARQLGAPSEEQKERWFSDIYSLVLAGEISSNEKRTLLEAAGITEADIQRFVEKWK